MHVYDLGPISKWFINPWAAHLGENGAFHVGSGFILDFPYFDLHCVTVLIYVKLYTLKLVGI